MAFPDLSKSLYVAQLRHIQSIHEPPQRRGPDALVRYFLPLPQRLRTAWISKSELSRLRKDPFYYYLLARTWYYDQVLTAAIHKGLKRILIVGCGSDTRAYRFRRLLCNHNVRILECDQAEVISERRRIVKRWGYIPEVEHLAMDLNSCCWPDLEQWVGGHDRPQTLVLMEGVSPYIGSGALVHFLQLLGAKLSAGSEMAYDFKLRGANDDFGRDASGKKSFLLSADRSEIAAFHRRCGMYLLHMELSSELCLRLLPDLNSSSSLFKEDALVRLCVGVDRANCAAGSMETLIKFSDFHNHVS